MTDGTRVALEVAYHGGRYSGFVRQANAITVAGELDRVLFTIDPGASHVVPASRTDAGVHARCQIASFTTTKTIKMRGWVLAFAQYLPHDVAVVRAGLVTINFDPRVDPAFKRYRYEIFVCNFDDPFYFGRSWRVLPQVDEEKMIAEAASLVGEHDFAAFRQADDIRKTTVRTLHQVTVERSRLDPRCIAIEVTGNRFMYHMVRIIAGTLVDVGRGRLEPGAIRRALESGERTHLGMTAPPEGLYLEHIELKTPLASPWPPQKNEG